jgi:hypothetical protein
LLWPECFPSIPQTYPALSAMLQTLSERASFKRIMPWHHGMTNELPYSVTAES